jgi:CDP-diacylglycerol--glycerol-3-phosphate 3-phosphatidyltransferase
MLYRQKGNFQKLIRGLGGTWMTANMATVLGCLFIAIVTASFWYGLTVSRWFLLIAPPALVLRMAMNALDGMLAREYGTGSVAGEIWNEALDILGDTVSYGVLYFVPGGPRLTIVLFVIAAWAAEYFGVLGKGLPNGIRRHETILGGKADRAFWFGALALVLFFRPDFLPRVPQFLSFVLFFVVLTCFIRVRKSIEVAKGAKYESYTMVGR